MTGSGLYPCRHANCSTEYLDLVQLLAQFEHSSARFITGQIEQPVELKVIQSFEIESGKGVSDPVFLGRQLAGRNVDLMQTSRKEEKL